MELLFKIAATVWFSFGMAAASALRAVDENDRRLQSNPAFLPDNGLLVMQAESVPLASPWKFESDVTGYTGTGFLRFDGNEPWGGPPTGELKYLFQIDQPGVYRLVMRLRSEGGSEENDCYIRIAGQKDYLGEVRKAYIPGRLSLGVWRWHTQLEIDHDAGFFPEPIYTFDKAGTYELQVWGRSRHLYFDRMIIYKTDSVTFDYAKDLARPESRRAGGAPAPAPIPVAAPVPRPVPVPVPVPVLVPVSAPVPRPVPVPVPVPVLVPVSAPVPRPVPVPVPVAVLVPVSAPVPRPVPVPVPIATMPVAAVPTMPSTGLLKLNLIHAPTNAVLKELSNGLVVDLKTYNVSPQFNIQAVELTTAVTRVLFVETNQSEGVKPFAFCGDTGGIYNICPTLKLGDNKVTVIAMDATGKTLGQVSLTFRVVDTRTAPVPVPVAVPVRAPVPVVAPVVTPVAAGTPRVTALIMVDASGKELHKFVRGIDADFTVTRDTVKFADIGTKAVTIKVETVGAIDHVKFYFNNKVYAATTPPYAMQGYTNSVFGTVPYLATVGDKSIRATLFGPGNVVLSTTKLRFIMAE